MKKKVIIIVSAALVIACMLAAVSIWLIVSDRNVSFELISETDYDADYNGGYLKENSLAWFSLLDPNFESDILGSGTEILDSAGIVYNSDNFDVEHYTYIVTVGHKLKSLKYSFLKCNQRNEFLLPKQFIGHATLDKTQTDKIYIYRIKKMNINFDIHDREGSADFE